MKQLTFYKYATIGLILLNIIVLGFLLLTKPQNTPHRPRPKNNFQKKAVKILNLNNQQQLVFNELAINHEKEMTNINKQQEILLLPFFENIANSSVELNTALVLTQFEEIQRRKLELTQQHLIKIKELLNEEQLPDYKVFINRVTERIITKKKNNMPLPKDFE